MPGQHGAGAGHKLVMQRLIPHLHIIHLMQEIPRALREKTEWVLHSIACRAAIKAGDKTGAAEMLALAQHIMDGTIPPFCPHGRPCVLKITRKELEKQFGRLV